MFDVLIVGSGPSGAHAAVEAVKLNKRVALLDIGNTPNREPDPSLSFEEIRHRVYDQTDYFLSPSLIDQEYGANLPLNMSRTRLHMVKNADTLLPLESQSLDPIQSTSYGGLGVGWGANVFTLNHSELFSMGLDPGQIRPLYQRLASEIGVCGPVNGVSTSGTPLVNLLPPLPLDQNARIMWNHYLRKEFIFRSRGIHISPSTLAVLSENLGTRTSNPLHNTDFYFDTGQSVYRPQWTLNQLKHCENFQYIPGMVVSHFESHGNDVTVYCSNVSSSSEAFRARRLILAAGAINSARIVLKSARQFSERLPFMCNPVYWIACIHLPQFGRPSATGVHSLSQLTGIMESESFGPLTSQFYSYRSLLYHRLISKMPMPTLLALPICRLTSSALVLVNLHFPSQATSETQISLHNDGRLSLDQTSDEELSMRRRLAVRRFVRQLLHLRLFPVFVESPSLGASVHYGGTLPFDTENRPFTCGPDGGLHRFANVYVADSSPFKYLPAKGPTFTMMANAKRVGQIVARSLG